MNGKKDKKSISKKKMAIIISLSVLAIIIATVLFGYQYFKSKIYVPPSDTNSISTEENKYKEVEGITNVLLIGSDGRTLDELSRSDSIMIATLDNNNKEVKLTSIQRDTLVDVPEYGEQKINAAFALGGAELLMETISDAFEIKLDKYVIVNFWGFESIIDAIGGIEIDIKDYEIENVNEYIGDSTETKSEPITKPGLQKLNGAQALSYSRIRSVGNGSYERSERQSRVLNEVAENLVKINPLKYPGIADKLSEHVKTNIEPLMALNYGYTIYKFPELKFEQLQIPQVELSSEENGYKDKGWVILIDKEQNAKVLNDFIFENKLPNAEDYDIIARENVFAKYRSDEKRYNSLYGIKPEEYLDTGKKLNDKDIQRTNTVDKAAEAETAKKEEARKIAEAEAARKEEARKAEEAAARKAAEDAAAKKAAQDAAAAKKAAEDAAAAAAAAAAAVKPQ
ncbi:LCP family protein [Clostridium gasigenes]|uniref:LCP family protein n=1 Tax=Clostridium gasigenes TaxID=94869 RepID=UPI001C0CA25C|nr:LCP family protein [Clostridium gasigenes]MBU3089203.1 LCP family protein [Clostridium gasigenes]